MKDKNKALLAAMLAVKRGLVDADEAIELLAQVEEGETESDAASDDAEAVPALSVVSASLSGDGPGIEQEVETLASDPQKLKKTLTTFGIDRKTADSLLEFGHAASDSVVQSALKTIVPDAPRARLTTPKTVDLKDQSRYQVKREQGRGGMGVVHLAIDTAVGREVAIKRLLPPQKGSGKLSPFTPASNPEAMAERFLREARVTGQLEHPNIVPVYEIGERDDGSIYYTMKFIRGQALSDKLAAIANDSSLDDAGRLEERLHLLDSFIDVCNALAYAHAKGVIHRDLKPDNVMLGDFGETLVVDWGLARVEGERDTLLDEQQAGNTGGIRSGSDATDSSISKQLTMAGAVIGTPSYMPPEQAKGELEKVDAGSDVYSLGAILFEIISGQPPVTGKTADQLIANAATGTIQDLFALCPDAPPELAAIALHALKSEPAERVESAKLLGEEVTTWKDGGRVRAYQYSSWELLKRFAARNKVALTAAALIALVAIAFIGWDLWQEEQDFQAELKELREELNEYLEEFQERNPDALMETARREVERLTSLDIHDRNELARDPGQRELRNTLIVTAGLAHELGEHGSQLVSGREVDDLIPRPAEEYHEMEIGLRFVAARLAALVGGYELAEQIVIGTGESDEVDKTEILSFIEEQRTALLRWRKERIEYALEDVQKGLARDGRLFNAPLLDDYIFELVGYRDQQTVKLLGSALKKMADRAEEIQRLSAERSTSVRSSWTQEERNLVNLCCRVLARLEMGDAAAQAMVPVANVVEDHELAVEIGWSLCLTRSQSASAILETLRQNVPVSTYLAIVDAKRYLPDLEGGDVSDPEFLSKRGNARLDNGNYSGSLEDFTRLISLTPTSSDAYLGRGRVRIKLLDYTGARKDFTRAIDLDEGNLQAHIHRGRSFLDQTLLDEAESDFSTVLQRDPDNVEALSLRANARVNLGKYEDGFADANKAISLDPNHYRAWESRGRGKSLQGDYVGALDDYSKAIALAPHVSHLYLLRAYMREKSDDLDGAIEDHSKAIELSPKKPEGYFGRATVYAQRAQYDKAIVDYAKLVTLPLGWDKKFRGRVYNSYGIALYRKQRYEEAIEQFNQSIIEDSGSAWGFNNRAQAYRKLKKYEKAIEDATRAVKVDENFVQAYLTRGQAYAGLEEHKRAIENLREGQARAPTDARFANSIGHSFFQLGEFQSALEAFNKAIELNPSARLYINNRALTYQKLDQHIEALEDFSRAFEMSSTGGTAFAAARSAALACQKLAANNPEDSRIGVLQIRAFQWLRRSYEIGYNKLSTLLENQDFNALHAHPMWKEVEKEMKRYREIHGSQGADAESGETQNAGIEDE